MHPLHPLHPLHGHGWLWRGLFFRGKDFRRIKKSPVGPAAFSFYSKILERVSGLFADVGEDAAVDIKDVAVDEIRRTGGQEHRRADEVFDIAPTRSRGLGDDEVVEGIAVAPERLGRPGGDRARGDAGGEVGGSP